MFIFDNFCKNIDTFNENDFNNLLERLRNGNSNIADLDVRGKLNPLQFKELFNVLKTNDTIESLILRGQNFKCDLSDPDIYLSLSNMLRHNSNIKGLTLYHTNIQNDGIESITAALEKNESLTFFKICGHDLKTSGELSIVRLLTQNKVLKDFTLTYPSMSEDGTIVLLSQYKYIIPINLDVSSRSYLKFCANGSEYINSGNEIYAWRNKRTNNPIEFSIRQKALAINKLINLLEVKNFPQNFITTIKEFCHDNIISAGNKIAEEYAILQQKHLEENLAYSCDQNKLGEVECYYQLRKENLMKKYSNIQISIHNYFNNVESAITQQSREVKPKDEKVLEQEKEILIELKLPIEKVKTFAPKKLDIDSTLHGTEYICKWVKKVTELNYDIVVFSIGSRGHKCQQIPSFLEGLGRRAAILNIDMFFTLEEMESVSNSDNISVNYLLGKIKAGARFIHLPAEDKQKYLDGNLDIKQEELSDNIYQLINVGKKVILLSHISVNAPRIIFEKILKNAEIMNSYGDKFLFIHSYFEMFPTILCSKKFVNLMMSPSMKSRHTQETYIFTDKAMPQGEALEDLIVSDKIIKLYTNKDELFGDIDAISYMNGSIVCRDLSTVNAHHIMPLLGMDQNTHITD